MDTSRETTVSTTEAVRLLVVPPHRDLSDAQFRGVACVWCAVTVSTETAVDLGQRPVPFLDRSITVSPRACRACTAERIPAALEGHTATCEQCVDGPTGCETARALRHLELEASR